jgi:hypothetical protein
MHNNMLVTDNSNHTSEMQQYISYDVGFHINGSKSSSAGMTVVSASHGFLILSSVGISLGAV